MSDCVRSCHSSYPALAPVHVGTEATQERRAVLRSLRMLELIDPEKHAKFRHPKVSIDGQGKAVSTTP